MSTENRTSLRLIIIICLALTAYNLYSVITLKEEIAELKGLSEVAEEEYADSPQSVPTVTNPISKPAKVKHGSVRKIEPEVKVRVEDRYVNGDPELPKGQFREEGTIVVKVMIDFMGGVTATSVQSSTIADEDVQYACREAALKTNFSSNVHADIDSRVSGTITYTFLAK